MAPALAIGKQAESVIIKHLLSKHRDKSLDYFKKDIDWSYQDPKDNLLTLTKVWNRLDYLRKLERDNRKKFLALCVENQNKVNSNTNEKESTTWNNQGG